MSAGDPSQASWLSAHDRQIRVFISSTFRDMQAERDHLVTVVFPELRERVEQLGLEFFDVDLRWGVPARDANGETANSWEYCRQWIDRVEPFFVCILGQRYGWVPEPEQLNAQEDRQRQQEERRSITDMEVRHAVLNIKLKRRSYFYLRTTEAPATASEYVDPPPLLSKLEQLKSEVRSCGRPARDYPCEWTGSGFVGLEEFGRRVLEDIWSGVLRDERYVSKEVWRQALGKDPDTDPLYNDESKAVPEDIAVRIVALAKPEPKEPLDAEREQMDAFATSRLRWFRGRTRELQQLTDFINSTAVDAPRLAVVAAVPGQGKSALLANLHEQLKSSPHFVITHFVGATERSASAHALVERLLDELDRSDITGPTDSEQEGQEPKRDFNSLCLRLAQRLGDYDGDRRILILLDALNQLSDGHDLQWLPSRLGLSVRVIVSCIEGASAKAESPEQRILRALASRQPVPLCVTLGPLTEADARTIVVAYLKEYCHELDREHLDALCAITQARNPLYLLVMLNELRTLGGNDLNRIVPARIASMAEDHPDTVSLFQWVLQRLEVFGAEAVRWWCLYLTHGRVGMASHELADLLARKLGPGAAAAALRIERGLRRYLQRRGPQLDFFHGQLRQAVLEQHGKQAEAVKVHADLATYFRDKADPERNQSWKGDNPRPFSELPFHIVHARTWLELVSTLEDIFFLEAKVTHGLAFELVGDFAEAARQLPGDHPRHRVVSLLEEAIRRDIQFIARHAKEYPQGLFQCLWNSCWWYDCPQPARHYRGDYAPLLAEGLKLHQLLERWRASREKTNPGFHWIQSQRPPPVHLGTAQHLVLPGHKGGVRSVNYSPDGRRIACGSDDNTVRVWDAQNGAALTVLRGHEDRISGLNYSFLDLRRLGILGHKDGVNSANYSPDGRRIASGADDNTVRVWDAQSGAELAVLRGHEKQVSSVYYSPDGRRIASGSYDQTVRVWDAQSDAELAVLLGHEKQVSSVCYSPDGRRVASGSYDQTVRVWDAQSGAELVVLRGHEDVVNSVSFSPDGRQIASGSYDQTVRVWDAQSGAELVVLRGHEDVVNSVSFSPDGRQIASGSHDKTVRVWDAQSGVELTVLRGHEDEVRSVSYSPDGLRIASGSDDNTARIWDERRGAPLTVLRGHRNRVSSVSFSPDGAHLASGGGWSNKTVNYLPDGGRLVNGLEADDKTVRVWDTQSGTEVAVLRGHEDEVRSVSYSPDGRRIASGSDDNTVRIWDAQTGAELAVLRGHEIEVNSVSFSPDGRRVASGSEDKTVRIWDTQSGAELAVFRGHEDVVNSVSFSPDGRRVASASDETVRVWDAQTGAELAVLCGHEDIVSTVSYSPDGRRIASESWDNVVRVWDAQSGRCLDVRRGGGDVSAIAAGCGVLPFRAFESGDETVVENAATGLEVAWFPIALSGIATHPSDRIWAGGAANYLAIIRLEGDYAEVLRSGLKSSRREKEEVENLVQGEHHAMAVELKSFEQHYLALLKVLTFALGSAFATGMFLIAIDIRNGNGEALGDVVVGATLGLLVLCAGGLHFVYPALESRKEKMIGWLMVSAVPIILGVLTGVAFWGQRLDIRLLGFRPPASGHDLLAKGMITTTIAVLWALVRLISILPHSQAIRKKRRLLFLTLKLLAGVVLLLPAQLFPAVVAALLGAGGITVCCMWISRKKTLLALSKLLTATGISLGND